MPKIQCKKHGDEIAPHCCHHLSALTLKREPIDFAVFYDVGKTCGIEFVWGGAWVCKNCLEELNNSDKDKIEELLEKTGMDPFCKKCLDELMKR